MDKKAVVYLYNGILYCGKKEETLTFCNNMDGAGEYYAKWMKPVNERQIPHDLRYLESNEHN